MRIRYTNAICELSKGSAKILLTYLCEVHVNINRVLYICEMRIRVIFMHIGAKLPIRAKINQCHYGESRLFVTGRPKYALTFRAG